MPKLTFISFETPSSSSNIPDNGIIWCLFPNSFKYSLNLENGKFLSLVCLLLIIIPNFPPVFKEL